MFYKGLHQHAKRMGLGYLLYIVEWLNGNCMGGHISAIPIMVAVDVGGANVGTMVQNPLL